MSDAENIRLKHIVDISRLVHKHLTWADDRVVHDRVEHWMSHAKQIMNIPSYHAYDDCDGYALTSAELAVVRGIPDEDIALLLCEVPGHGFHLVCELKDLKGAPWIICNNFLKPQRKHRVDYKWVSRMRLSNKGTWEHDT